MELPVVDPPLDLGRRVPGSPGRDGPEPLGRIDQPAAEVTQSPEIAQILGLARRTVHHHLENIYAKLGVETPTAAAIRALEVLRESGGP
jgi:hypothetical protein